METALINHLRQQTTALMPVVDYDKPSINTAIEQVYSALIADQNIPALPAFSEAQKSVIINVITAYINRENEQSNAPEELWVKAVKLKIVLLNRGLLETIDNLAKQVGGETYLYWEYDSHFNMYDAKVQAMKEVANMTDQELLDIFTEAQ